MKKFFSLLAVALCSFTSVLAQVTVKNGDEVINDGDIITYYATESIDEYEGDTSVVAGPQEDPTFWPAQEGNLSITVTAPQKAFGKLKWCAITASCEEIEQEITTRSTKTTADFPIPMELHAEFNPGQYDNYVVGVELKNGLTRIMSFYINYVYDAEHASSIEGVTANQTQVVFTGNALNCQFANAASRTVQVYSLDGKLVKSVATSQAQATISLNDLQQGVYVYSVAEGGQKVKSGKVVLK
ncbi:secreted protein [gut metagenome]|uniref:Secreted protein n=1 Tax=gut metagenome TaxID=749906 RepID=J9FP34_9ZZZZ